MGISVKVRIVGGVLGCCLLSAEFLPVTSARADDSSCDYSMTTLEYSCSGSEAVRQPTDVVGARIYSQKGFQGRELTVWVPTFCPKNNRVDWLLALGNELRAQVSSVQAWSGCWVWLYRKDGSREGPYTTDVPDVGSFMDNQAVVVGLS